MTYEKLKLKIEGMECSSCEILLERKLKQINSVKGIEVNHSTGKATLICSKLPTLEEIRNVIDDPKYSISIDNETPNDKSTIIQIKRDNIEISVIFLILVVLYFTLKQFNIISNLGVTENMSYGFIFLIGLVAAFSTCMAVSGGLLLAVSTKYNELHQNLNNVQKFRPHIYFNTGRIISYTLLGGLLGAFGSIFKISEKTSGIIIILSSVVMVILGFQILKLFPKINKFKIKMPKFIAHKIHDASASESKFASFLLGAGTFFLPCGFTQALQIYVLSQGNFTTGALSMLAFSLGTLPALASIGFLSSFSTGNLKKYFIKFVGVLVIILGFVNLGSGFTLTGINLNSFNINTDIGIIKNVEGKQVVEMRVDGLDYYPPNFEIKAGVPVEFRVDGRNAQGCARVLSIPKYGISEYLSNDDFTVIKFTPQKPGNILFTCSMGMAGPGTFIVS